MKKLVLTVFAFLSLVCAPAISNAQDVKIGVLYPLTGPVAQVGKDAVAAVKTALDIIKSEGNYISFSDFCKLFLSDGEHDDEYMIR